jgi:hypothetical protein
MTYITPSDFASLALDDTTPTALVAAASALIDAHCHRPTLSVAEYTERLRVSPANAVRLTYLPLTCDVASSTRGSDGTDPAGGATLPTPFVSARVRYAAANSVNTPAADFAASVAQAFALPGSWTALDPETLDFNIATGEVTLPANLLGLRYSEAEFTYHAGFPTPPDAVKHACAQIVRNALATPALNVRASSIERMHMEYFADSLLTADVRTLLKPYVARRVG